MDPSDPRVIALAAAIREIAPSYPDAHSYAYIYARVHAHDFRPAHARICASPSLTDEQQAQIGAAYALLFD